MRRARKGTKKVPVVEAWCLYYYRMGISVVQLGSPRKPHEGLRIGTVRRPPRGVPKSEFAKRDYYDVWLPALSPTPELVALALHAPDEKTWKTFERKFRAEM